MIIVHEGPSGRRIFKGAKGIFLWTAGNKVWTRLPSSVAGRDLELKGTTNLTVVSEQEVIIQSGYLDQGAEPRARRSYAVVVKGKFTREQNELREEHEARIQQKLREENKKVIQRAKEGLPAKGGAPSPRR